MVLGGDTSSVPPAVRSPVAMPVLLLLLLLISKAH